jgi:SAM-dependent methyltransferase
MLGDLFGYYLLQVGWSQAYTEALAHCRIRHHLILESRLPGLGAGRTLVGEERALPVASDCVDAVFLPHTLDFAPDPYQVLREAERVLIPEGRLVVLGFNPWGSWGWCRLLRRRAGRFPWNGRFLSPQRVSDWLNLMGFDLEWQEPLMFLPPLRRPGMLRRLETLEPLGRRWMPWTSGGYGIRAVKRVSTLTPVQPMWKIKGRLLPGQAVEPTARGGAGV